MDLSMFQDLKRQLAECTDFPEFWRSYFDNFAENEEFLALGRPVTGAKLRSLIHLIASKMLGSADVKVVDPMLVELPESELIHGSCVVNNKLMCILFFPDLDLGMAAISHLSGKAGIVYGRFSITQQQAIAAAN